MLEQLFGSKTRTKLLKIFLLNPEQAFYIRELTRMIDTQINSVRRELQNLVHCGVIIEVLEGELTPEELGKTYSVDNEFVRESGNLSKKEKQPKKFFRVNKNFVLHKELHSLFKRSPLLFQQKFIKDLQQIESVEFAIITGFFLEIENSTVDLLIVGTFPRQKLSKLIGQYEKLFDREINFTTMTPDEFDYRKSLTDRFLFSIIEGRRQVIVDRRSDTPLSEMTPERS